MGANPQYSTHPGAGLSFLTIQPLAHGINAKAKNMTSVRMTVHVFMARHPFVGPPAIIGKVEPADAIGHEEFS
jgi:hypothetical protein